MGNVIITRYVLLAWLVQSPIPTGWLEPCKAVNGHLVVRGWDLITEKYIKTFILYC